MDPIRCYHSRPQWTWEKWQWKGTLHSPKLQHNWNLTIRLFSVISVTLVDGGLSTLQRSSRRILMTQQHAVWEAQPWSNQDPERNSYLCYWFIDFSVEIMFYFILFLWLMAYRPPLVIGCQSHLCRWIVVALFNPYLTRKSDQNFF